MTKILVIDDDMALRTTLEIALQLSGYQVAITSGGEEGLAKAREWLPDVVFCDVNMPGMDGRVVLQTMRSDPALAHRQIVMMTGDQRNNPQREGMNLGADDYLPKPFEIGQLRRCVEARLRRAQINNRLENGMLRRHSDLFGTTLPHEFMTPLNGILGFAEILKEDLDKIPKEESLQMLGDIESCARRLHRTLQNYLLLIRMENEEEQGRQTLTGGISPERAVQIVSLGAQEVAARTGRKKDLVLDVDSAGLAGDEADLQKVVTHLVENAFGYSIVDTRVTVRLKTEDGRPTLRVEDNGRGITEEQIGQIGAFTQFDRKRFEQQGLGIGLTLVKRLIERHGGAIRFDSTPGKGTTVIVQFKAA